ncbi:hypothetical protein [Psychrobacter sp.]|uniref:hypothetical protein n=1 Tax=Psychrobacter sp. TaxID=56811 RepID=UPI0025FA0D48|nr:hypothetical protein [Psychrobacter sp.]
MNNIPSQQLNARELLMLNQGSMYVTFIPTSSKFDWVIPTALIIGIKACEAPLRECEWQGRTLPVFSLLAPDTKPDSLIVLEAESDMHRLALIVKGQLKQLQIRITDIKDIEQSKLATASGQHELDATHEQKEYEYQQVIIDNITYMVPDLQRLTNHLIEVI